jgi:hypothetical protein
MANTWHHKKIVSNGKPYPLVESLVLKRSKVVWLGEVPGKLKGMTFILGGDDVELQKSESPSQADGADQGAEVFQAEEERRPGG